MNSATNEFLRSPRVVVVGAGMTGILLAIKLQEAGISDVTILEKAGRVGGTWRENTYPGVACDIPAHLYSYSFEPNPDWSHRFAPGDEIQAYFQRVADKYGVTSRVRFNESVVRSVYAEGVWKITTDKGDSLEADFVINCTGILHHPSLPDIPELDTFTGDMFHTARWNHDTDLAGKSVGIIGTGSTAAQVIPELAGSVSKLSVFQRTPQWVLPIGNKQFSEASKQRLRSDPGEIAKLANRYSWGLRKILTKAVTGHRFEAALLGLLCRLNLRFGIRDPQLRKKLTPDYKVGCKRIVISNRLYPAMEKSSVELVTEGIQAVVPEGVVTQDGKVHQLDVLILSTGFKPTAYMRPVDMIGIDGISIDQAWSRKIQCYRSLCMPGFPNNFLMLGPNTPTGNYSVIAMSEVQCAYIMKLIHRWRLGEFDALDVSAGVVQKFGEYIKRGMANTAWASGCSSWYLDADGDPILWPYSWEQWEEEMAEPDMEDFVLKHYAGEVENGNSFSEKVAQPV